MSAELFDIVAEEYKEVRAKYPSFGPGDTINVHYKIKEGNKERIQQFQGTVMQIRHKNTNGETFTVRKVSSDLESFYSFHLLIVDLTISSKY